MIFMSSCMPRIRPSQHSCTYDDCNKSFPSPSKLTVHIRTHTGEKPYICDATDCDAAFAESSKLTLQRLIHTVEGQQRRKKQEELVAKALTKAAINFKREHDVSFALWGDTFARTDFLIVKRGGILIGEVDEGQHDGYGVNRDVARMGKLHKEFMNTLPIGMIRYNPDSYEIDGKKQHKLKRDREAELVRVIKEWQFGGEGSFEIQYMYYDTCTTGEGSNALEIWDDPVYDEVIKQCCRSPIC